MEIIVERIPELTQNSEDKMVTNGSDLISFEK